MRISDWSSDVCSSDLHDVTHVVVPVRGHALVFGDHVAVQVEDAGHHAQAAQSGFFLRLAQGAPRQVAVAVGVAAELEPAIKLAVVGQPHALPRTVDQPGRGGELTGQELGTAHVCTPVTTPHLVCRPLLTKKHTTYHDTS